MSAWMCVRTYEEGMKELNLRKEDAVERFEGKISCWENVRRALACKIKCWNVDDDCETHLIHRSLPNIWQPIYLNLKISHPPSSRLCSPTSSGQTGNDASTLAGAGGATLTSDDMTDAPPSPLSKHPIAAQHAQLRSAISINGEIIDSSSLDQLNIHDNISFEQEHMLTNKFIENLKRRSLDDMSSGATAQGVPHERRSTFKMAVKSLVKTDKIVQAMKKYSHRSDSESSSEDEESPTHQLAPQSDAAAADKLSTTSGRSASATDVSNPDATNFNNNNSNDLRRAHDAAASSPLLLAATQKNMKEKNELVFSSVVTEASTADKKQANSKSTPASTALPVNGEPQRPPTTTLANNASVVLPVITPTTDPDMTKTTTKLAVSQSPRAAMAAAPQSSAVSPASRGSSSARRECGCCSCRVQWFSSSRSASFYCCACSVSPLGEYLSLFSFFAVVKFVVFSV